MANTFRKVYKKTGNSGSTSDYQLVGNIGVNGVELNIMKGASSSVDGELGLVPKPTKGQENYVLGGNGIWISPDSVIYNSEKKYTINNRNIMGSNCTLHFHRLGNICLFYFRGILSPTAGEDTTLISNDDIPEEFRPSGMRVFSLSVVSNINVDGCARMILYNDGKLTLITNVTGQHEYYVDGCYFINSD